MKQQIHYLFLYTRLPDYFYRCVEYLLKTKPGAKATIVCYPKDDNAPYEYPASEGIRLVPKTDFLIDSKSLISWHPDCVYVAGWGDKDYNRLLKNLNRRVPVVMGMDNPWKGTARQLIAILISKYKLRKLYSYIWIPGYPQYEFARKLGFKNDKILKGLYCTDLAKFRQQQLVYNRTIIYVGRMVDYKRPDWLLESFSEIVATDPDLATWQLTMIGSGPLSNILQKKYADIKQVSFVPFVQPSKLIQYYHAASIFCMPSINEHWGVVVQEAAASGLALLLSDSCGAASEFLLNGYNGFVFKSLNKPDFRNKLRTLMQKKEIALMEMRKKSLELAERVTEELWCGQLNSVFNEI